MSYAHVTYNMHRQDNAFDQRVKDRLNDEAVEDLNDPETWTAETVKKAAQHFLSQDEATQNGVQTSLHAEAWIKENPWYVDKGSAGKANGAKMRHELISMGLKGKVATMSDFDTAAARLYADGLLTINKAEFERLQVEQLRVAEKARKAAEPTIDQMYEMDLDELRMRANGVF